MTFDQKLLRTFNGPAWHGASVREILAGVDADIATRRVKAGQHNIAELVTHMIAWREFCMHMIQRDYTFRIEINSSQDWPVKDSLTQEQWTALLKRLSDNTEQLAVMFASLTSEQLNEQLGDRPFNLEAVVDGVIDHDIYHSAQIALVKKFVSA